MSHVVDEVALSLSCALRRLGAGGKIVTTLFDLRGRTPIILLANVLKGPLIQQVPPNAIIYNLEQVSPDSRWFDRAYLSLLCSLRVWDYYEPNRLRLEELGVRDPKLCPIGYVPELTKIAPAVEEDIDVLFYGSFNQRRVDLLRALAKSGLAVIFPTMPVFGIERDQLIARSKIVINIHYFEAMVPEIVRLSYLMANKRCVVSEAAPFGLGDLDGGVAEAPYEELVERCQQLVASPDERKAIAAKGFELFSKRDLVSILEPLIEDGS